MKITSKINPQVIVVGAGFTGLAAAYELSKSGYKVLVVEKESQIGGLAGSFEISNGFYLEKFYHHFFQSDLSIIKLLEELNLKEILSERDGRVGFYYANSIFRLSTPFDLLCFKALPLIDRIRVGLLTLSLRFIKDWKKLEEVSAFDWFKKIGGAKSFEVIWEPLLKGKFGTESQNVSAAWLWNKVKLRGSSRSKSGRESLIYPKGGFKQIVETLVSFLEANGSIVKTNCNVKRVICQNGRAIGVDLGEEQVIAEKVLVTTPLPVFLSLVPELPQNYTEKCSNIKFLSNICLILRLKKSLSHSYWLNVADPSFPFVGLIEHTNFDLLENYGNEHVVYLSKYLTKQDPLYQMTDLEIFNYSMPYIKKIFPEFDETLMVKGYKIWRADYSQPISTISYSKNLPDFQTPIKNLWLCTMAQIYPQDRGTNYAVEYGRRVARMMIKEGRIKNDD